MQLIQNKKEEKNMQLIRNKTEKRSRRDKQKINSNHINNHIKCK